MPEGQAEAWRGQKENKGAMERDGHARVDRLARGRHRVGARPTPTPSAGTYLRSRLTECKLSWK